MSATESNVVPSLLRRPSFSSLFSRQKSRGTSIDVLDRRSALVLAVRKMGGPQFSALNADELAELKKFKKHAGALEWRSVRKEAKSMWRNSSAFQVGECSDNVYKFADQENTHPSLTAFNIGGKADVGWATAAGSQSQSARSSASSTAALDVIGVDGDASYWKERAIALEAELAAARRDVARMSGASGAPLPTTRGDAFLSPPPSRPAGGAAAMASSDVPTDEEGVHTPARPLQPAAIIFSSPFVHGVMAALEHEALEVTAAAHSLMAVDDVANGAVVEGVYERTRRVRSDVTNLVNCVGSREKRHSLRRVSHKLRAIDDFLSTWVREAKSEAFGNREASFAVGLTAAFDIIDVRPDGDCLFAATYLGSKASAQPGVSADALREVPADMLHRKANRLRLATVKFMARHPALFAEGARMSIALALTASQSSMHGLDGTAAALRQAAESSGVHEGVLDCVSDEAVLQIYAAAMRQAGVFGERLELAAVARMLGVDIHLFYYTGGTDGGESSQGAFKPAEVFLCTAEASGVMDGLLLGTTTTTTTASDSSRDTTASRVAEESGTDLHNGNNATSATGDVGGAEDNEGALCGDAHAATSPSASSPSPVHSPFVCDVPFASRADNQESQALQQKQRDQSPPPSLPPQTKTLTTTAATATTTTPSAVATTVAGRVSPAVPLALSPCVAAHAAPVVHLLHQIHANHFQLLLPRQQ